MDDINSKSSNHSDKNETEIKFDEEFKSHNINFNKTTEEKYNKNNLFEMKTTVFDNIIKQSILNTGDIKKENKSTLNLNNFKSSLLISNEDMNEILNNLKNNGFIKQNNNQSNENSYLQSSKINIENIDTYIKQFSSNDITQFANKILELDYNSNESNQFMAVHPLVNIYIMIEQSFKNDKTQIKQMKEKYNLLKDYIYYRKIKGDGNCFYRAIIFKYLEIIILNNEIDLLKNMILDVERCFKNEKIKQNLNIGTLDVINPILVKKVLISIYFFLIQNNIQNAYKLFNKAINMSKKFDMGLILYFRYTLYKYIEENQNKLYTESFPIQIGNLLPGEYETEDGKFLFNKFYDNYLLKLFNDAEKIVIYLTPFIFPIKLNVILYEENNNNFIQEYCSDENINTKNIITVNYSREHFELIYSKNEYEIFKNYLSEYINNNLKSYILEPEEIIDEELDENIDNQSILNLVTNYSSIKNVNLNGNLQNSTIINTNIDNIGEIYENGNTIKNKKNKNLKIIINDSYNKNENNKNISESMILNKTLDENQKIKIFPQFNKSEIFSNKTTLVSPILIGHFTESRCEICKSLQNELFPSSQITVCNKCFKKELIKEFERKYFLFITQIKDYILKNKIKTYKNLYNEKFYPFMNNGLKICNVVFTIEHLKKFSYNFQQYILIIKKKMCLNCQKNFTNNNVIQVPCNCVFCSINCIKEFYTKYVNLNDINLTNICCLCCIEYSFPLICQLRNLFQKYKLNQFAIKVTNLLNKKLAKNCAKCNSDLNKIKPISIIYNNNKINSSINQENLDEKNSLKHFLCTNCFYNLKKEKKIKEISFSCIYCKKIHYDIKTIK